jgi:hypothetical protein
MKAANSLNRPVVNTSKNGTCLNDHPQWIEAMARILRDEGHGWLTEGETARIAVPLAATMAAV